MRNCATFILILLIYACSDTKKESTSKRKSQKVVEEEYIEPADGPCVYESGSVQTDTLSLYQKSTKIVLYGYVNPFEPFDYSGAEERKKKLQETLAKFDQRIFLNQLQKDSLFKILTGFKKETTISEASCYDPRHRISFFDKDDKTIGEIHLCFSCNQTKSDIPLFKFICDDQLNYYENFFRWCGITKGFKEH